LFFFPLLFLFLRKEEKKNKKKMETKTTKQKENKTEGKITKPKKMKKEKKIKKKVIEEGRNVIVIPPDEEVPYIFFLKKETEKEDLEKIVDGELSSFQVSKYKKYENLVIWFNEDGDEDDNTLITDIVCDSVSGTAVIDCKGKDLSMVDYEILVELSEADL
jgi:hypothetical protein